MSPDLREVEERKLPILHLRDSIVSFSRLFCAPTSGNDLSPNLRNPNIFTPTVFMHSLVPALIGGVKRCVCSILNVGSWAKIASSVVKRVMVDVVWNIFGIFQAKNFSVHQNRSEFTAIILSATDGVESLRAAIPSRAPLFFRELCVVVLIHKCKFPLSERNVLGAIGRWRANLTEGTSVSTDKLNWNTLYPSILLMIFGWNVSFLAAPTMAKSIRYSFREGHARSFAACRIRPALSTPDPSILALEVA